MLHINPIIYAEQFARALEKGELIDKYRQLLTDEQMVARKYFFICEWLRLKKAHPIAQEIAKFAQCKSTAELRTREAVVKKTIYEEYGL
jgi:hypothetical protein